MTSNAGRERRGCRYARRRRKEVRNTPRTSPARRPRGEPTTISDYERALGLPFAAFFIYSPRGTGAVSEASRRLCARVKVVDPLWFPRYVGVTLRASLCDRSLAELFRGDVVLVPVPGSAPVSRAPWVALRLA